jgi:heptosyltransferase-1
MTKLLPKKSVLLIRLSSIGDIVMASPVASAIKQHNPNTVITWVVQPSFMALVEGHPHVDHVVTCDINELRNLWKNKRLVSFFRCLNALQKTLNERSYDSTVDLQGNFYSGLIAYLSGAPHRIALGSRNGNHWFMTKTISRILSSESQIGSEYRYLVNQLGYSDAEWEMYIPRTGYATASAQAILRERFGSEPYAVICPFALYAQKNWLDDYWQQIILRIRGRYKLRTVIVGGKNGKDPGEKIARASGAINLAGVTSIEETAAIISGASLVIGVDTGLTHMGHALKAPTISLFGATCPYTYAGNETSKVIYLDRFCSPCKRKPTCNKQYNCMREITPDHVLTAIKPLLIQTPIREK